MPAVRPSVCLSAGSQSAPSTCDTMLPPLGGSQQLSDPADRQHPGRVWVVRGPTIRQQ